MSPQRSGNGNGERPGAAGAADLAQELRQPLAAASNYIGVARLLIASFPGEAAARALHSLEEAETQLIRAGKIVGRLQRPEVPTDDDRD